MERLFSCQGSKLLQTSLWKDGLHVGTSSGLRMLRWSRAGQRPLTRISPALPWAHAGCSAGSATWLSKGHLRWADIPRRWASGATFNVPPSSEFVARSVGVCTMMRLPLQSSPEGLDAAFVGVPLDIGTSNRPGTRFGPRRIREESVLLRTVNPSTGALPFQSLLVADIGDVDVNLYNLQDSCQLIREAYQKIVAANCIPLTLGGDHTITYPILQALAEKHGPVGLLHVDAHTDTADKALGEKLYHGTPFRRCVEEGLLDCKRVVQIGIRGPSMTLNPYKYSRDQGFRVVLAEDCWLKSLVPLMGEVRQQMGDKPIYISFDIDALDPAYAPGTGTPEIAGLTPSQALEIVRGCQGLNVVGCDLVEVAPAYDPSGNTALLAANLLFEMLCVLPKVKTA
ncbi:agmatinase, mitochondrial [Monodelphis domestica]|uniref:agmatinase, mitochondrial n=1 Tax=Monodelphis domestica TaxID=13616 RepID=UPI0024E1F257|nr:agmatinase, mitochondrial [Monodelphis domestica]